MQAFFDEVHNIKINRYCDIHVEMAGIYVRFERIIQTDSD